MGADMGVQRDEDVRQTDITIAHNFGSVNYEDRLAILKGVHEQSTVQARCSSAIASDPQPPPQPAPPEPSPMPPEPTPPPEPAPMPPQPTPPPEPLFGAPWLLPPFSTTLQEGVVQ